MIRSKTNDHQQPKLYVVGTPIGNLDDITYRAVKVLQRVDMIYCEDTRITARLLQYYHINTKLKSYHIYNEKEITNDLIDQIKAGKTLAVVSDAGMPGISDPGFLAVKTAIEQGIIVEVIPGPSASLTALVASGIACNQFCFMGFLNSKTTKRKKELVALKARTETLIVYEAPHRIKETLEDIYQVLGDRYIVLARELTKRYEEWIRGTVSEVMLIAEELKGEMVLIIQGVAPEDLHADLKKMPVKQHYQFYIDQGYDVKIAMKQVATDRDISKNEVYQEILGKNK